MKKKTIYGITLIIAISLLTGCGKAKLKNGEELVAKVDGYKVTADTLYKAMVDKYGVETLINSIDHELLDTKYKTDDTEKSAIDNQIAKIKQTYGDNEDTFLSVIKQLYGCETEEEFRDLLSLDYKRDLAIQDYVAEKVVTDEEVDEYYNTKVIGEITASHILIKPDTSDDASEDEKSAAEEKALKKAESIIQKLKDGEDFAKLAKKYSDDKATANDGGKLGTFNRSDNYDENFVAAAAQLKKGKYTTEPVKTKYGYEIILKTDEKDKAKKDDVKDEIRQDLAKEKINSDTSTATYYQRLKDFRESKGLKFSDSSLEKKYNEYMDSFINKNNTQN